MTSPTGSGRSQKVTAGFETWVNSQVRTRGIPRTDNTPVFSYHRRLPDYAETPLLDCPTLAAQLGVRRVWVKDESTRFGLPSFKILGASWAVYRVLCERLETVPQWKQIDQLKAAAAALKPLTLLAATDGNHGRAVARMAALLGLDCRIYLPSGTAAARLDAIASEGASIVIVDGDYEAAVAGAAAEQNSRALVISDTSWPGYDVVPHWVCEGYSTIFQEVDERLMASGCDQPSSIMIPIGVGALASAAILHYREPDRIGSPHLVGVEPIGSACVLRSLEAGRRVVVPGPHRSIMAGLNCGTPSAVAWPLLQSGLDVVVAVDDDAAREAMRDLDAVDIEAGETGAAALAGAKAIVNRATTRLRHRSGLDQDAAVLLIVTEGPTDPVAFETIVGHAPRRAPSPPSAHPGDGA
jgi:diaminopropionate ammonia-lyase